MASAASAVIITVGEELLSGATTDGNAAWLGRQLARLGVPVVERFTVGDRDDRIVEALHSSLKLAEVVVFTGGLGPTDDDRTRPAVAQALGLDLTQDVELVAGLEARFIAVGHKGLPTANLRQAMVPDGATVLPNPVGTAPGLWLKVGDGQGVALLPGVPREMRALFPAVEQQIALRLGARLSPSWSLTLHTTGIAESVLAPQVEAALNVDGAGDERGDLAARLGVDVAYLPELTGVDLRLTTRGADQATARAALEQVRSCLFPIVVDYLFEAPETGDLVEALGQRLQRSGLRLATAESCTGGGVAERLTRLAGASSWYAGSVVAYDNRVKQALLGVDASLIERFGAVSEPVAEAMAHGVLKQIDADCAIALTGVAGPGGGSAAKPVGTVCIAIAWPKPGTLQPQTSVFTQVFPGDREAVRVRAGQAALAALLRRLEIDEEQP
jgi:nicotinamide-nucleotide amidase